MHLEMEMDVKEKKTVRQSFHNKSNNRQSRQRVSYYDIIQYQYSSHHFLWVDTGVFFSSRCPFLTNVYHDREGCCWNSKLWFQPALWFVFGPLINPGRLRLTQPTRARLREDSNYDKCLRAHVYCFPLSVPSIGSMGVTGSRTPFAKKQKQTQNKVLRMRRKLWNGAA